MDEAEKEILRQGNLLKEFLDTPGWKEYARILEEQIVTREKLLQLPIIELWPQELNGVRLDFVTKAAAQESIKGAIIGLRAALSLPASIVEHASEIRKEARTGEKG